MATGKSLWVLRADVPVEVAVAIGANDGSRSVVVSTDLAEGDQVITDQQARAN